MALKLAWQYWLNRGEPERRTFITLDHAYHGDTVGAMSVSAAASEAIYEAFLSEDRRKTFFHGHSYAANPLACAVGLASLDLFRDEDVLGRIARLETQLRGGLGARRDRRGHPKPRQALTGAAARPRGT